MITLEQFEKTIKVPMTKEEKACIVGFWRMGYPNDRIAALMGISEVYVELIIENHLVGNKNNV